MDYYNLVEGRVSVLEGFKGNIRDTIIINQIDSISGHIPNSESFLNVEFEIMNIYEQRPKVFFFNCVRKNYNLLLRNKETNREYLFNTLDITDYTIL